MTNLKYTVVGLIPAAVLLVWAQDASALTRVIVHRLNSNPNVRYHTPRSTYYSYPTRYYGAASYYGGGRYYYGAAYYGRGSTYYRGTYYPPRYRTRSDSRPTYRTRSDYRPTYRSYRYSSPRYTFSYTSRGYCD